MKFYDGNQLITTAVISPQVSRKKIPVPKPISVQSYFKDNGQEVQIVNKAGDVLISNKSPATTTQPVSVTEPIPKELIRQDQWYHEGKEKMVEYGIRRVMNRHKKITPDQKAAFFRNVRSMDFSVAFGDLVASILSDVKDEVFRQADMIESGQRIGRHVGKCNN